MRRSSLGSPTSPKQYRARRDHVPAERLAGARNRLPSPPAGRFRRVRPRRAHRRRPPAGATASSVSSAVARSRPATSISVPPPTGAAAGSRAPGRSRTRPTPSAACRLQHLRCDAPRVRTGGADMEDECSRDGMAVRRHRAPGRGVGASSQALVELDPGFLLARPLDVAGVDPASLRVVEHGSRRTRSRRARRTAAARTVGLCSSTASFAGSVVISRACAPAAGTTASATKTAIATSTSRHERRLG